MEAATTTTLVQIMEKLSIDVSKNKDLKKEIDEVISNGLNETADAYWPVLKLALMDSNIRIVALNTINKLVAHVLLQGKGEGDSAKKVEFDELHQEFAYALESKDDVDSFTLIDEIVLRTAQIAFKQEDSVAVQLQVIKLYLTIVTAESLPVHGISLLMILKVCFLIHSSSPAKSTNEVTSKASLTQMINLIFLRLERFPTLHRIDLPSTPLEPELPAENVEEKPAVLKIAASEENLEQEPIQSDEVEEADTEAIPDQNVRRNSLLSVMDQFEKLKRDVRMVFKFLCMFGLSSDGSKTASPVFNVSAVADVTSLDELSAACIKDRVLGLELLLSVFQNLGHVFRKDSAFLTIIKTLVPLVISRNAVTTNPILFELSLSIFLLTIRFYRHKLKLEIEVQLGMYLQILELGNSTYKQKSTILQGLLKICENPQTLIDIYLNYDCEFEMSSIYEKMISICSRITQGRGDSASFATNGNSGALSVVFGDSKQGLIKQQDRRLHLRALCILTAIIQSLVAWTREMDAKRSAVLDQSTSLALAVPSGHEDESSLALEANPVVVGKNPLLAVSMKQNSAISGSTIDSLESENDKAEMVASKKQLFRRAIKLFATSPKKGMKAFISGGFVENSVESISQFLFNTPELNKASIGDYIGEGEDFNIKVMHAFIDIMDFSSFNFVSALRHFLQSFRLPGEAQKIDRMMEKFADRYCEQNPTVFAKADTAYTLAFSVIMLNTDQHSAQIKHRMDKAAFIKNNRGINDDGDLPDEFLGSIFDEIATNEIIMEDERSDKLMKITLGWGAGESSEKQRREVFKQEMSLLQKKTQLLMTQGATNRTVGPFRVASDKDLTRSMFSTCSWALMAAFSVAFEGAPDENPPDSKAAKEPDVADLCLSGFSGAICLACMYHLETERDAFVSSLSKLTSLTKFYDIKPKHIKAIGVLIEVATQHGEYLETSWIEIIKSLSLLEKMQSIVRGDDKMLQNVITDTNSPSEPLKDVNSVSKVLQKYVEDAQSQNFIITIDRIFTTSVKLSAPAIIAFFKAVCQVSLDEVGIVVSGGDSVSFSAKVQPRMYLLQKIVEIAHYNMHRIRFEWTQIWRLLQPHFNRVACHPNVQVANFAVDSLRQLGAKFLEREELGQFSAQHEFLKSFEFIIKQNGSPAIRELILSSLSQLITARASRIRSGWKSIFVTLAKAAQTDEKLASTSFQSIQLIFRTYFEDVVSAGAFVDLVSCLAECALLPGGGPVHDELVMSSIHMLQSCTKSLIERAAEDSTSVKSPEAVLSPTMQKHAAILRINNLPQQPYLLSYGFISEEHFFLSWFPILSAFSRVVNESEGVLVRTHTMEILFETLKNAGHLFQAHYWKSISRNIISPLFEELRDPDVVSVRESNSTVMILGLRLLTQLASTHFRFFSSLSSALNDQPDFLQNSVDTMVDMMTQTDDKLASTGQTCFSQFLTGNVENFDERAWAWTIARIERGFRATLPSELVKCQDYGNNDPNFPEKIVVAAMLATRHIEILSLDSLDFEKTIIKCITHLEFLSSVKEFCFLKLGSGQSVLHLMPKDTRGRVLDCMFSSYVVARLFNSLTSLRHAIYKRGWVAQLPNLVKQETTSLSAYITLLFSSAKIDPQDLDLLDSLGYEILDLFRRFNKLLSEPTKYQRDIISWSPIVVTVFKEMCEMEFVWDRAGPFSGQIPEIYQLAVKMIGVDKYLERAEMKMAMIEFFAKVGLTFL